MQNNNSVDIQVGSEEEMELIDKKLGEFNGQQVPFTQTLNANNEPVLLKNYVIKENGVVIAGIKSFIYDWGIVFIELLFVEKSHRHQKLGTLLLNQMRAQSRSFKGKLASHVFL